jgi:hypothetical protein
MEPVSLPILPVVYWIERFAKGTFSTSTHPGIGGKPTQMGKLREKHYESL